MQETKWEALYCVSSVLILASPMNFSQNWSSFDVSKCREDLLILQESLLLSSTIQDLLPFFLQYCWHQISGWEIHLHSPGWGIGSGSVMFQNDRPRYLRGLTVNGIITIHTFMDLFVIRFMTFSFKILFQCHFGGWCISPEQGQQTSKRLRDWENYNYYCSVL